MDKPRIAVTMGDPAGIGPELCLRAVREAEVTDACTPLIYGDAGVLRRVGRTLGLPVEQGAIVDIGAIDADGFEAGVVSGATGLASYRYIERAIDDALAGRVDGVCTGPINKEALHAGGVAFPGHTEIFAAKTDAERACMMLTSPELTVSFATTHVGYRDVPGLLSVERVLDVIELTAEAMSRLRGRPARLLTCGLNPHAGENGLFGDREEERFIVPAVAAARERGVDVDGPVPPDTAFLCDRRERYDAVVCMYHDQGHIPLKTLAFDTAINITLGLPIVRTSVDHGTALDIAWTGKANPTSLYLAIRLAAQLAAAAPATATTEDRDA